MMIGENRPHNTFPFLTGSSEMGKLMQAFNWHQTALGAVAGWPSALKVMVGMMLSSPMPICITWGSDFIQLYNDAYRPLLGSAKHPGAMGKPVSENFAEIWDTISPLLQSVMQGKAVNQADAGFTLHRNGYPEQCYFDFTYSPIVDEHGQVQGVLTTVIETTDRVKAATAAKLIQQRLEAAQAETIRQRDHLKTLFMQAPAIICIHDGPDFIFEFTNPRYDRVFPGRNLLGKPFAEALPELVDQGILDILKNIYETGESYEGKEVYMPLAKYDGGPLEDHYFNFIYQARYNEHKQIDGIMVFAYEVTDQVMFRKKIEESEARLNLAAASAEAGIYDTDLLTRKVIRSQTHARIFGYPDTKEEWTLDKMIAHIVPQDLEQAMNAYQKNIATGNVDLVYRIKRTDGQIRWINVIGKVSYDSKNQPIRITGTTTDITEKKQLQQQRDEFISTVSHELKTPITSLKAYTQMLQRSVAGQESARNLGFLERMDSQIKRLENLIRNLLDVTRIESGKLELKPTTFAMDALLTEVVSDLQLITPGHQLTITKTEPVTVHADRDRLTQVITNLLTNAVKYAPHAKRINLALWAKQGRMICSVQDFGEGISPDQKLMIFERFYQANRSNMNLGLGLGLYISREIIALEGGEIWFESEPEKGTTFYFSLPVYQA